MANFTNEIRNMVQQKMNFGYFYAQQKELSKKYGEPLSWSDSYGSFNDYYSAKDGRCKASAKKAITNNKTLSFSISDYTTGRDYSSNMYPTNSNIKNDIPFTSISTKNYTIFDVREWDKNDKKEHLVGQVDENDIIEINGTRKTIKEFLEEQG